MHALTKLTIGAVVMTSLSGCLLTRNQEFNERAADARDLRDELDALPVVDRDDIPDAGSATYTGVASLNLDQRVDFGEENMDYYSDVTLTANFSNGDLEGNLTNFQTPEGAVDGTLTLENGQVIDNFVDGDFVGTITDDGQDIAMDIDIDGLFRGDGTGDPAGLSGDLDGDYITDDGTGGGFGAYVATID